MFKSFFFGGRQVSSYTSLFWLRRIPSGRLLSSQEDDKKKQVTLKNLVDKNMHECTAIDLLAPRFDVHQEPFDRCPIK